MVSVVHVNHNDSVGGAARAAFRLHTALKDESVESSFLVARKRTDCSTVSGAEGLSAAVADLTRRRLDDFVGNRFLKADLETPKSVGLCPGNVAFRLKKSPAEVVNLHWLNQGAMSVRQIGHLRRPTVWTMHDMWALTGASHYSDDAPGSPWQQSYSERAYRDVDAVTFRRKKRHWRHFSPVAVAPSHWMFDCLARSPLTSEWERVCIPNPLPVDVFAPANHRSANGDFGVPAGHRIILFGADGGTANPVKGWRLLEQALHVMGPMVQNVSVLVFGQDQPISPPRLPFPIRWLGRIHEERELVRAYNAATVMAVPSTRENLPQTAMEATSCGTPVVAFEIGGMSDVVEHGVTGFLAQAGDYQDLALQLMRALRYEDRAGMQRAARGRALRLWAPAVVARQYSDLYDRLLREQ